MKNRIRRRGITENAWRKKRKQNKCGNEHPDKDPVIFRVQGCGNGIIYGKVNHAGEIAEKTSK